jgi:BirA family transcriptional regulator, biotin operon repressor / biotin---[acetyl-CoA-carboxylase] ligase
MATAPLRPRSPGALAGPLVHLDVTGSTNDRARELALAGAPSGTVVLAEEQTSGRGRQGRSWIAPRGNALTLSVVWRFGAGRDSDLLPLAAAVCVCEACERLASVRCAIKWPNDVWVDERKLAGILIESRPAERWSVIGIGLNVNTTEDELGPELEATATSLRIASGSPVDRDLALDLLLERLAARLPELARGSGELLSAYRERDVLNGRKISWRAGTAQRDGEARGIDGGGRLVVFTAEGEELLLDAGEIHLGGRVAAGGGAVEDA